MLARVFGATRKIDKPVIACSGLAYKADIDDLRESPAIAVVCELALAKAERLLVVEPHVRMLRVALEGATGVELVTPDQALADADIVVLLTDHRAFRDLDRKRLAGKAVFDSLGSWR